MSKTDIYLIIILLLLNIMLLTVLIILRKPVKRKKKRIQKEEPEETYPVPDNSEQEEDSISRVNAQLVLSQIGPHFIFNSLNTIYYLCEKDTEAAQEAISEFSAYLRGNIDSFRLNEPITFSAELMHVRHYLAIEKLRYGEDLKVSYDIHDENFYLPALSVQAMVENAVRHGIGKRENGGSLWISAWRGKDTSSVTVKDNGVGFDPEKVIDDGRSHTGIENVRILLDIMCSGTLEILSRKGEGTTVVIRVPNL